MRLIQVESYELREFDDDHIPEYAILSHRWENQEVTLTQMQRGTWNKRQRGWVKIQNFCEQVRKHRLNWAWIDTCCIDKTSSAELSEAINSMFNWYRRAQICLVYMYDVSSDMHDKELSSLMHSVWFTRGWTLQELLAPSKLDFYNLDWQFIGDETSLSTCIARASGISTHHLRHFRSASVAQRLSWASRRSTTRPEDAAYSLMGLFNINMPLLYGEGRKAFLRLQLEIIKGSDDESIFAWEGSHDEVRSSGLLAPSLSCFKNGGGVEQAKLFDRPPYSMTNKGLAMQFKLVSEYDLDEPNHFNSNSQVAPLNCRDVSVNTRGRGASRLSDIIALHLNVYAPETTRRVDFERRHYLTSPRDPRKPHVLPHGYSPVLYIRQRDFNDESLTRAKNWEDLEDMPELDSEDAIEGAVAVP